MLIASLQQYLPVQRQQYYNVDAFAGEMAIAKAFRVRGLPAVPLDLSRDPRDEAVSALAQTRGTCMLTTTGICSGYPLLCRFSPTSTSCAISTCGRAPIHGACVQLLGTHQLSLASMVGCVSVQFFRSCGGFR